MIPPLTVFDLPVEMETTKNLSKDVRTSGGLKSIFKSLRLLCTFFLKICCLQIYFGHCQKPLTGPVGRTHPPDHRWGSLVGDSPTKTPSHLPW